MIKSRPIVKNPSNVMSIWYFANVTVHVLAAMLWLGGMLFLGVVGAPVLRAVHPPELRQQLFHKLGLRFRVIGWWAIGVLLVTGVINLYFRGWLRWSDALGSLSFWQSVPGHALAGKLAAVTAMLVVSAVHDFGIGPSAGREAAGSPRALQLRRRAALLARVNALLGVIVVVAAVRLARG
jgi:copper resistance protein D